MHSEHHEQQQIQQKQNVHGTVFLQNIQILPSISNELLLISQHNLGKQTGRVEEFGFQLITRLQLQSCKKIRFSFFVRYFLQFFRYLLLPDN